MLAITRPRTSQYKKGKYQLDLRDLQSIFISYCREHVARNCYDTGDKSRSCNLHHSAALIRFAGAAIPLADKERGADIGRWRVEAIPI